LLRSEADGIRPRATQQNLRPIFLPLEDHVGVREKSEGCRDKATRFARQDSIMACCT